MNTLLRIPPQSVEAEQAVIGGLMLDPRALARIRDIVCEGDFYRRDHQLIFRAITELDDAKRPYDAVTVGEWFESQGLSEQVDGGAYLVELASTTPSAANIRAYAEIVADKARLRALIDAGTAIVNDGFQPDGRDTDELAASAVAAVAAIAAKRAVGLKSVNDAMVEMVEDVQRRIDSGDMLGTSFGLPAMDYMTAGKKPGDLIIIAGRPSMGKTTLALQGALAAGRPLIFSFETMAGNLMARMTAHVGQFPLRWITHPNDADTPDNAMALIHAAMVKVKERLKSSIYDRRRLRWEQLRAIALQEHERNPVREVVIDHLGHMLLPGKGRQDQELGEVTKGCKELAREMGVPVVLLMQLNRGVEQRQDKRPLLSDLRECGAAEEDADIVAMLYRDEYYNHESPLKGYGEIFLRKNRDGEPGEIWTRPVLSEMRFEQAEPQQRSAGGYAPASGNGGVQTRSTARVQPGYRSAVRGPGGFAAGHGG